MEDDKKKKVIVMIDDDTDIETIVDMKLRSVGFDVRMTTLPQVGLRMVEEMHPDLVLLDINMPGMSGMEFLAELQGHVQLQDMKFALFSSMVGDWSQDAHKQEMLGRMGAHAFIDKAIDLDLLVKEIRDLTADAKGV